MENTNSPIAQEMEDNDYFPSSTLSLFIRFLQLTGFPSLIFIFAFISLELKERKALEQRLVHQQNALASFLVEGLGESIRDVLGNRHLSLLKSNNKGISLPEDKRKELEQILYSQVNYSTSFDQLRILDATGMEVVRINQEENKPEIVPRTQLQDKAGRYYFKVGLKLDQGYIYMSPIDLNVEHGAIEVPHKPVLRVSVPVVDNLGKANFYIVANIRIQLVFDRLFTLLTHGETRLDVIDTFGYFLLSPEPEIVYGWQLPGREVQRMGLRQPRLWQMAQKSQNGLMWKGLTLYSWQKIDLADALLFHLNSCGQDFLNYTPKDRSMDQCSHTLVDGIDGMNNATPLYLISSEKLTAVLGNPQVLTMTLTAFFLMQAVIILLVKRYSDIELLRLRNERNLQYMAYRDPLTGLHNRRGYREHFYREYARGQRTGKMPSLILLDIDYFKQVNDTFGHDMGDQVLKILAGVLMNCLRVSDQAARHGGEEFTILLPETNVAEATTIAERIRINCSEMVGQQAGLDFPITVSLGVSHTSSETTVVTDVLKEADSLMYVAKELGRNRVVSDANFFSLTCGDFEQ